ncbi:MULTISPECIES: NADPH-dependent FMN reductase [Thermomonospora]|uniref:NADPH-dependent FMN reductase n=1 Tax=Thermomonospora TaxID=2019 RepID=UPI000CCB2C30|nr:MULTISPECIES: NAD(P)H-dependent oxidoreductase [Thermomonospora]PKK16371.1 MAG: FMN reductase [Thermomonospora sp. CIF 1]TNY38120.1 NAD(P)H-dependent oxidoreductase [Thermomonospora catenispora]
MTVRVLALVGSLRAGSHNRRIAEAAARLAPENVRVDLYGGLGELPFYNEDIDTETAQPEPAARLRAAVREADALLLVSPEYNGSIPAVLKNAIDWLSRPYGAGAIAGKPVAVVGTALGRYGGVWAHEEIRKAVRIAGGTVLEDVKLAVPDSLGRFGDLDPADDPEVAEGLSAAVDRLTVAASSTAAA